MLVKRANVVLEVDDDSVQHYLDLGYSVIDEQGKVLVQAIPSDLGELRKFYVEGKERINKLLTKILFNITILAILTPNFRDIAQRVSPFFTTYNLS